MDGAVGAQGRDVLKAAGGDGDGFGRDSLSIGDGGDRDGVAVPAYGFGGALGDVKESALGLLEQEVEGARHFGCGSGQGVFVGHSFEGDSFFDLAQHFVQKALPVRAEDPRHASDDGCRVEVKNGLLAREFGFAVTVVREALGCFVLEPGNLAIEDIVGGEVNEGTFFLSANFSHGGGGLGVHLGGKVGLVFAAFRRRDGGGVDEKIEVVGLEVAFESLIVGEVDDGSVEGDDLVGLLPITLQKSAHLACRSG